MANQLFSCYAKVGDARSLASVIGEDELSPIDKKYLIFGNAFEKEFIGQGMDENRSMEDTLNKAWDLLGLLPRRNWTVWIQRYLTSIITRQRSIWRLRQRQKPTR